MQDIQIITYPYQGGFTAALFFKDSDSSRIIMHNSADPSTAVRTVYGRYLDDPYSHSKEVEVAQTDLPSNDAV